MDQEIQKTIDDFVTALGDNEEKLLDFNSKVVNIFNMSKTEMENVSAKLDQEFGEGNITEDQYLESLKLFKKEILEKSKSKLGDLLKSLE